MLRAALVACVGLGYVGAAQAQFVIPGLTFQTELSPAQKRNHVLPFIIALSDCVANRTLQDSAGTTAFRNGTFDTFVPSIMDRCPRALQQLTQAYDQIYGQGQGEVFVEGAYAKDLPRAVLARIKPQLVAKAEEAQRADAEQAARDAQARTEAETQAREAEAERQRAAAEEEQRAATARAEADRAKAVATAAAEEAEVERLKQVEIAKGAAKVLAVKALGCARDELRSLVKSNESAEILASAVTTICGADVDHYVDAGAKEYVLENQVRDDDTATGLARGKLRSEAHDQFVALAVQAKAGVGVFAASSN